MLSYVSLLVTESTRKPAGLGPDALCMAVSAGAIPVAGSKNVARYNQTADGDSHKVAVAGATPACAPIHKTPTSDANRHDRRPANEAAEGRNVREIRTFGINPVAVGFQATTRPDQFSLQA